MLQTFIRKLVQLLTKALTYESFALMIIDGAKVFFKGLVELLTPLIEQENEAISALIEAGAPENQIEERKAIAAHNVTEAAKAELSASPSWIPTPILKAVQEAIVYVTNYGGKEDSRNEYAKSKGFFRSYESEEYKDVVDRLNKGWGNR